MNKNPEILFKLKPYLVIILLGLVQGGSLLLGFHLFQRNIWPLQNSTGLLVWFTVGISLPLVVQLMMNYIRSGLFWMYLIFFTFLLAEFAIYTGDALGPPGGAGYILIPYIISVLVILVLSVVFVQTWISTRKSGFSYSVWERNLWNVGLTLFISFWFTVANGFFFWILGSYLYLLKLAFSWNFTLRPEFMIPVYSFVFSVGLAICQLHKNILDAIRKFCKNLFFKMIPAMVLLTLATSMGLLFNTWLDFWNGNQTFSWTLLFQLLLVVTLNGLNREGLSVPFQERWMSSAVRMTTLILPLHTVLYYVSLYREMTHDGWSIGLFWEILFALLIGFCAIGYAFSAVNPREDWFKGMVPMNIAATVLAMTAMGLISTPYLDPKPLVISSQLNRLMEGKITPELFDYDYFGMHLGKKGQSELVKLTHLENHSKAPVIRRYALTSLSKLNCQNKPAFPAGPVKPIDPGNKMVFLMPLDEASVPHVEGLASFFQEHFGLDVHPLLENPEIDDPYLQNVVLDWDRRQLVAEELVAVMKKRYPKLAEDPKAVMIGLTSQDMFIRDYNWRFAFSFKESRRFAVVSSARMDPRFHGKRSDPDKTRERIQKMMTRNIGFMYYDLGRSNNRNSVLCNSIMGIDDLDAIGNWF